MSETKTKIDAAFETFNAEYAKFAEKGNASAGTRARTALMDITKLAKEIR